MHSRSDYKHAAKQQIKGNIGRFFLCMLVVLLLTAGCAIIPFVGWVSSIVIVPCLNLGMIIISINLTRGISPEPATLFKGFNQLGESIATYIFVAVFTSLWSLLLIIPGIIKAFAYSMSFYVLADNPQLSAYQAIKESQHIMKGHKFDLFIMYLSFIPWILLCCITLGIAYIYVMPYISATTANFYNSIKSQQ